ncbi:MAG: DNA helicase [Armatimonadetes bacterium]|nr:DNA helicase [Armatimonadota bacterium]
MKLSAPIFQLKRQARLLAREKSIALHEALDTIAQREGLATWSHLASAYSKDSPAIRLYRTIRPGSLVLIAARPGQGKTLMGLELALIAMKGGHKSVFFTLEYTQQECLERFKSIGQEVEPFGSLFTFDGSDDLCADYIIRAHPNPTAGTMMVVDYLQLLDQRRENADLSTQVNLLHSYARDFGVVLVFLSQIDRSYDPTTKPCPEFSDLRLPNPLDLELFQCGCFLHGSEMQIVSR